MVTGPTAALVAVFDHRVRRGDRSSDLLPGVSRGQRVAGPVAPSDHFTEKLIGRVLIQLRS